MNKKKCIKLYQEEFYNFFTFCMIKKIKQSHYRPEVPREFQEVKVPDYVTLAQDGGKLVSLTHRPLLPPGNTSATHFC